MGLLQNIALAWKNRDKLKIVSNEVDAVRGAIKAAPATGYISSEFLTVVVGAGFVLYNSFAGHPLPDLTQEVVAGIVGLYAACRTILKAIHAISAVAHTIASALHAQKTTESQQAQPNPAA